MYYASQGLYYATQAVHNGSQGVCYAAQGVSGPQGVYYVQQGFYAAQGVSSGAQSVYYGHRGCIMFNKGFYDVTQAMYYGPQGVYYVQQGDERGRGTGRGTGKGRRHHVPFVKAQQMFDVYAKEGFPDRISPRIFLPWGNGEKKIDFDDWATGHAATDFDWDPPPHAVFPRCRLTPPIYLLL